MPIPRFAHVGMHELAHVMLAALTGGRLIELRVSARDGHVIHTSRRRRMVAFAPYVIPFGAVLWVLAVQLRLVPISLLVVPGLVLFLTLHARIAWIDFLTCRYSGWHGTDFGVDHPVLLSAWTVTVNAALWILLLSIVLAGFEGPQIVAERAMEEVLRWWSGAFNLLPVQ